MWQVKRGLEIARDEGVAEASKEGLRYIERQATEMGFEDPEYLHRLSLRLRGATLTPDKPTYGPMNTVCESQREYEEAASHLK